MSTCGPGDRWAEDQNPISTRGRTSTPVRGGAPVPGGAEDEVSPGGGDRADEGLVAELVRAAGGEGRVLVRLALEGDPLVAVEGRADGRPRLAGGVDVGPDVRAQGLGERGGQGVDGGPEAPRPVPHQRVPLGEVGVEARRIDE